MDRVAGFYLFLWGTIGLISSLNCVKQVHHHHPTHPEKHAQQNTSVQQLPFDEIAVVKQRSVDSRPGGPQWLEGLKKDDILVYVIRVLDGPEQTVRLRVEHLSRIGDGVAARFEPIGDWPDEIETEGFWLAGDSNGLYRFEPHQSLQDPGFCPLDSNGNVIPEGRTDTRWRIPLEWQNVLESDLQSGSVLGHGWIVDELDLMLDGPVQGDPCARVSQVNKETHLHLTVCANLGIVEIEYRESDPLETQHWKMIGLQRKPK